MVIWHPQQTRDMIEWQRRAPKTRVSKKPGGFLGEGETAEKGDGHESGGARRRVSK